MFEQIDMAANRRTANFITITDLAQSVLFNASTTVDGKLSDFLMIIYKHLKDTKQDNSL